MTWTWLIACAPSLRSYDIPLDPAAVDTGGPSVDGAPTGDDPVAAGCDALSPVGITELAGWGEVGDFDVDDDGYAVWHKLTWLHARHPSGDERHLASGISLGPSIARRTPAGDFVVVGLDRIERVTPGGQSAVVANLPLIDGIEVDRDGWVFASDPVSDEVVQIDPDTRDGQVIAQGIVGAGPLALSAEESTLFVAGGDGILYQLERLGADSWSAPVGLGRMPGIDRFAGIVTDSCGNLYGVERGGTRLSRRLPDGEVEVLAELPAGGAGALRWGRPITPWSPTALYVPAAGGALLVVEVGVDAGR
ncbi:MAG: hypothetical protein ABMA64_12425 [Myxococcota bacterium]